MIIKFQKYQGTGNDFIIIDNTDLSFPSENYSLIKRLCDRKYGIGSDGLILINPSKSSDFSKVVCRKPLDELLDLLKNSIILSIKFPLF